MIYIYAPQGRRPQAWQDLAAAKQAVEADQQLKESDAAEWWEHSDRWVLAARWRAPVAQLWKVEI